MSYSNRVGKPLVFLIVLTMTLLMVSCSIGQVQAPQTPGGPAVRLSPDTGAAGAAITATGGGWSPAAEVTILLNEPRKSDRWEVAVARTAVRKDGTFKSDFNFPVDPRWQGLDQVLVTARVVASGEQVTVVYRLQPSSHVATNQTALAPVSGATATPIAPDSVWPAKVTAAALNVRSGPSTTSAILTTAKYGDALQVRGQDATGVWVLVGLPDGMEGWVARAYTDFTGIAPFVRATPIAAVPSPVITRWRGEYFANPNLSGAPVLVRSDARVNFNWRQGAPSTRLPIDGFSARWTRQITLPADSYSFKVESDGGVRAWLNDMLIIDEWRDTGSATHVVEKNLAAGVYAFRVEYFDQRDLAQIAFGWQRNSIHAQWRGEYFSDSNLTGNPALVRNDATIAYDWGSGSPASGIPADNFSARWTRSLAFEEGLYRFHITADDGVRLYVDGDLLVDAWNDGLKPALSVDHKLSAGMRNVRLEYYERAGNALISLNWVRVTAYPDWLAEFWARRDLTGTPALVRNDSEIDFNWGSGSPASGIPADNFSARWSRALAFEAGVYRFHLMTDDGVRLWVNDHLVIDSWQDGARELMDEIALANATHMLRLEYYERAGDAKISLWWERMLSPVYNDWRGEYFANQNLSGNPTIVRNDRSIDFRWGSGAPAPGLPADRFSARWSRTVDFRSGVYRLSALSDDGIRVYLDGNRVLDKWYDQAARDVHWVEMSLSGTHRLVVEYYDHAGGASATFQWQRVGDLPPPTSEATQTSIPPTATQEATARPTNTVAPVVATTTKQPTVRPTDTAVPPVPTATHTPQPLPSATATETPIPTSEPVPQTGTISGLVCWPEDATFSALSVYFQDGNGQIIESLSNLSM